MTLKEYFERRLLDMEKAVTKAEASHEKRLESLNEFRDQLKDQADTFVEKSLHYAQHDAIEDRINGIRRDIDKIEGRTDGGKTLWAYLVSGASLIGAIISIAIALTKGS